MPNGGARPGAGRPLGSGGVQAKVRHNVTVAERIARATVADKLCGTDRDPMEVLAEIGADKAEPSVTRIYAASKLLPFCYAPVPVTQVTVGVRVNDDAMVDEIVDRVRALRQRKETVVIEHRPAAAEGDD